MLERYAVCEADIRGRVAEVLAASGAALDNAGDAPIVAEDLGRPGHVAFGQQFADPGGGEEFAFVALRFDHCHTETVVAAQLSENAGIAAAALSKKEVVTDRSVLDSERPGKDDAHEIRARRARRPRG